MARVVNVISLIRLICLIRLIGLMKTQAETMCRNKVAM